MCIKMVRSITWKMFLLGLCAFALAGCQEREVKDEVFYFVMPDRYANGNTGNDTGGLDGDKTTHGYDATDQSYYHGGDLKGLKKKLPYLEKMGVTSIWMTPIFENSPVSIDGTSAGYHGYWAQDYMKVDPHLGTNKQLRSFIRAAHRRDIKVFFDIVVNHTADVIRYDECHNPDGSPSGGCGYRDTSNEPYTPFIPDGLENVKNPAWMNDIQYYNNRGDSTFSGESSLLGDFFGLDDVDTTNPVVVEGMIDIFNYWISEFKIDGFRLDTVKHVNIEFWQAWTPAVKAHAASEGIDDFFIFGEIFDGNPANVSRFTTEGTIDSAVDFGLYYAMRDVFANNSAPSRLAQTFAQDDWYTDADSDASTLLSFVSNHDVGRLGYDILQSNPDETDEEHLARLQQAYAMMYFGRGIPVIYYGDEQGFVGGGGDKEAREDMMPSLVESHNANDLIGTDATTAENNFDRRHPMYRTLKAYKKVLDLNQGLRRGAQYVRYASNDPGIFAFSRVDDDYDVEYLVVMNTSKEEKSVTLEATTDSYHPVYPYDADVVTAVGGQVEISVAGLSTIVFKGNTSIDGPSIDSISLGLTEGNKVKGRFEVPVTVSWLDDAPIALTDVEFYVAVNGGEFEYAGTDHSEQYRIYYDTGLLEDGAQLTFRAIARDQDGYELVSDDISLEVGLAPGLDIVFKKPDSWGDNVNIYYWEFNVVDPVAWPGIAMDPLGDGWYRFKFPEGGSAGNIIFNDGVGNQSSDLFRDRDGCYIEDAWVDICEPPVPGIEITFLKPDSWGADVNMYYWDAEPAPGVEWPGVPMENLVDNWYRLQLPTNVSSANIIFNDGQGNQTSDLFREGDGCYRDGAWQDTCDVPLPGIKVSFLKPADWADTINIYYWEADPAPGIDWPGVPMTHLGNDIYEYQFPANVNSANIIFNDGQGNQTDDLNRNADGCYDGNAWVESCDVAAPTTFQIAFLKPADWADTINIYYWQADPAPAVEWPGVAMESLGQGWYTFEFPEGASSANIIFNDGQGNQTADLNRTGSGCYLEGAWVDTCELPGAGIKVSFVKPDTWGAAVNIYYWEADPAPGVDWPGVAMTDIGDGVFEYQFPANVVSANIIFNDGEGNQTTDLFRDADGCYTGTEWVDSCEVTGGEGFLVNFLKPEAWGDGINIYYWQAEPLEAVDWPGVPMLVLGDGWYSFEFPAGVASSNIIFNDGQGNQTADLNRASDGCYVDDAWVDTCAAPVPGLLLTFRKPASWGDMVNAYYWEADPAPAVDWPGVMMEEVADGWYQLRLPAGATSANIIFNDGEGNQTPDLFRDSDGCYGIESDDWVDSCELPTEIEIVDISAHWVELDTVVWDAGDSVARVALFGSTEASLAIEGNAVVGFDAEYALTDGATMSEAAAAKFRHLANLPAVSTSISAADAMQALKGQLVVAAYDASGALVKATRVQVPGVIDELFATDAPLGVQYSAGAPSVSLWAPTAQQVMLSIYNEDLSLMESVPATTIENGVHIFEGGSDWNNKYYQFDMKVYHPANNSIAEYAVTDPYSINLNNGSAYSQFIDLEGDSDIKPAGWDGMLKSLPEAQDITVYEGHVRDFSGSDMLVAEQHRGKYLAFTYNGENGQPLSNGMSHLKNLKAAGLSHFHLLPVNDIASINEDESTSIDLDDAYSRLCALSSDAAIQSGCAEFGDTSIRDVFTDLAEADPINTRIQQITTAMRGLDGFNWGYDPYHFLAVEGSYANESEGKGRVLEFREMVKGLNDIGLNVVVDVVFNHTNASGLWDRSVLDRVVPGYYHRLDSVSGAVANSTCCDNTAAEHYMMERLMIDAIVLWAKQYKIDAFRFDLMGHHPKSTMENIKAALATLTLENDGVQGDRVYLYGEGWDFGEVSGNQRFDQATQFNMGGTGIGTFNDRLRAAVRGGNFTDNLRSQGFANGNGTYMNGVANAAGAVEDQADRIRIGLAGNLRDYTFIDNSGAVNTGLGYGGVGYALNPSENVVYVDKHDNEALWDNTQGKLPDDVSMNARVRVQSLSHAFVNFSQGVPFHQMGSDILRSKSMHRNTYDAGDWANQVDFSLATNNWAKGLPEEGENSARWDVMREIMSNANIAPQTEDLQLATDIFQEQLQIRYSSELFRLASGDDVKQRVAFWNTGTDQAAGLIAMTISDGECAGPEVDSALDGVAVIFNADDDTQTFSIDALVGTAMSLHQVQQFSADDIVLGSSYDSATGAFTVPGQTAAVFVSEQVGAQGSFPCNTLNGQFLEPGAVIYFEKPADWEEVNIYFWDTAPGVQNVDWPGSAMESIGDNWYRFQFADGVSAANIIFNNNAGGQTADLSREGDGCYSFAAAEWTDTCDVPGITLSFVKPADWAAPNLYFWEAAVPGPDWPGTAMEDAGGGLFTLTLPTGVRAANVIFNDGAGNQTGDLSQDKDACYSLDDGWQEQCLVP